MKKLFCVFVLLAVVGGLNSCAGSCCAGNTNSCGSAVAIGNWY